MPFRRYSPARVAGGLRFAQDPRTAGSTGRLVRCCLMAIDYTNRGRGAQTAPMHAANLNPTSGRRNSIAVDASALPDLAPLLKARERALLECLRQGRSTLTAMAARRTNALKLAELTSVRLFSCAAQLESDVEKCVPALAKVPRREGRVRARIDAALAKKHVGDVDPQLLASKATQDMSALLKRVRAGARVGDVAEGLGEVLAAVAPLRQAALAAGRAGQEETIRLTASLIEQVALVAQQTQNRREDWYETARRAGPVAMPGWDPDRWSSWEPPRQVQPIFLGDMRLSPAPEQEEFRNEPGAPAHVSATINDGSGFAIQYPPGERDQAISAARGLMLRIMAAVPPGKARFTIFDPLGLGESVAPFLALNDHDPRLLDGKVYSSEQGLRDRLDDLTAHLELVIQKYLRGEYATIEEFNAAAGDIAEPYRYFVVFDYPNGFSEECAERLTRIIDNGPRCGVFPLLVMPIELPTTRFGACMTPPSGPFLLRPAGGYTAQTGSGETVSGLLTLARDPLVTLGREAGQVIVDRVVDLVGKHGRGANEVTVDLERSLQLHAQAVRAAIRPDLSPPGTEAELHDESTWWRGNTKHAVSAPIGQSGARDVALLRFDSEILSGGLLVGRPGSGKSTLLHTWLAALCTLYPPQELELHLIDFREGVEFKAYAEHALPHARCVAVESEREFGLSVLESLVAEMRRRAALVRTTGGQQTTFANVRDAVSDPLPRIVLVFDEFHVLFSEPDAIGLKSGDLLEALIRQGRGFGLHVLLGSQSISGLDALGRHVLQLLPVRILLPSSELDAQTLLGDQNVAWRLLQRRGEGILNPSGGAVEANVPFQGAFESDADRITRLSRLRARADSSGFVRRPVVFEGHEPAALLEADADQIQADGRASATPTKQLTLRIGLPMTLEGPLNVSLRREAGAHVLVVAPEASGIGSAVVSSALASALAHADVTTTVIDLMPVGEGLLDLVPGLRTSAGLTSVGRRGLSRSIEGLASCVRQRTDEDDRTAAPILLLINGIGRARDLNPSSGSDAYSEGPDPLDELRTLLVDGPEVGVHVLTWADSLTNLQRRLPRSFIDEMGVRVVAAVSRDASLELLGDESAAQLKPHQVRVVDEMSGLSAKARCHELPSEAWLDYLLKGVGR